MAKGDLYYFDQEAVDDVVCFFEEYIVHTIGEWYGKPFILMPWEYDIIKNVFGWKRKSDYTRRYRTVYVEIPKKSGKSPFASALALYMLCADGEHSAEVYAVASAAQQAGIVYTGAKNMVHSSTALREFNIEPMERAIFHHPTMSRFKPIANKVESADGINASCIIIDELHRFAKRDLYDLLEHSMKARKQPLLFIITTAGWDRNSICWEVHEKAERIRDGKQIDDSFYPVIYSADIDEDWKDPEVWKRVNPSLGVTVKLEDIQAMCDDAIRIPGKQSAFRRYVCNQWVESNTPWLDITDWDACGDPDITLDALHGEDCFAGVDLAAKRDLAAKALLFPPRREGEAWILILKFYMPADNVRRRVEDTGVPYVEWVQEGFIKTTKGDTIDYEVIREDLNEDAKNFNLIEVAFDPWNAQKLMTDLENDGFDNCLTYSQTIASMSAPMKEAEKMLIDRSIEHDDNPVMRWMVGNVVPKEDSDERRKPDRSKSADKIDGVVAWLMALGRAIQEEHIDTTSIYETQGIDFI